MDIFLRYKAIKSALKADTRLAAVPLLWYTGQYQRGKDNVSIIAPAIYIEMPKQLKIDYFPRKLQVAKDAVIKIHILSIAPYKSMDNPMQDAQIEKHNQFIAAVQSVLNGFTIKDSSNKVIASQFILQPENPMNYMGSCAFTILGYKSEFYEKEGS